MVLKCSPPRRGGALKSAAARRATLPPLTHSAVRTSVRRVDSHLDKRRFFTMPGTCVVGLQWGDEAKGKIVDLLGDGFDLVVRYNGGDNAGHTVVVNGKQFKLSLLPT